MPTVGRFPTSHRLPTDSTPTTRRLLIDGLCRLRSVELQTDILECTDRCHTDYQSISTGQQIIHQYPGTLLYLPCLVFRLRSAVGLASTQRAQRLWPHSIIIGEGKNDSQCNACMFDHGVKPLTSLLRKKRLFTGFGHVHSTRDTNSTRDKKTNFRTRAFEASKFPQ